MTTRLEISKQKLERIKKEKELAWQESNRELKKIPLGQPNIIGRRNIYKKGNMIFEKLQKLNEEEKKQEMLLEKLEKIEKYKEQNKLIKDIHVRGKSGYANIGARTSVNNLEYFKDKLNKLQKLNEEIKMYNKKRKKDTPLKATYGAEIKILKDKILYLERIKEQSENGINNMSDKVKQLIENEKVTQWKKKPIYYFVNGLKKVALTIDTRTGEFVISKRYPPMTEEDKQKIRKLLD